jgi:hypothetical protein
VSGASESAWSASTRRSQAALRSPEVMAQCEERHEWRGPGRVPRATAPCLTCFRDFGQRSGSPRGDTSRWRKTIAVASAAFRRGRRGSLGDHGSVPDPEREIQDPGHRYWAQGCERGVRVRLVSFHAPVTGRPAVSRARLGLRRPPPPSGRTWTRRGAARRADLARAALSAARRRPAPPRAGRAPGPSWPWGLRRSRQAPGRYPEPSAAPSSPTILARRIVPRLIARAAHPTRLRLQAPRQLLAMDRGRRPRPAVDEQATRDRLA